MEETKRRIPRGIRNNNPLNIEYNPANHWVGEIGSDGRFCRFAAPEYGYRAALKTLRNYRRLHGKSTLRELISRWCPPAERGNNTEQYIDTVSRLTGIAPGDIPDLCDRDTAVALLAAMAFVECGVFPALTPIEEAWRMLHPAQRTPL